MTTTTTLAAQAGYDIIGGVFNNTSFLGQQWIIPVMIVIISMILITRSFEKWSIMLLPLSVGWRLVGLEVPYILIIPAGIIFGLSILNQNYVNMIETQKVAKRTTKMGEGIGSIKKTLDENTKKAIETAKRNFRKI